MRTWLHSLHSLPLAVASMLAACCDDHSRPTIVEGMDWDILSEASKINPKDCSQVPLLAEQSDMALVFIGGFFDSFHGSMRRCFDKLPPLSPAMPPYYKELRAYYYWEGNEGNLFVHSTARLVRDINAWVKLNPESCLVLVGHSYGGSSAMDVVRHVSPSFKGKLLVATLDPVSRRPSTQPQKRAPRVDYWVNAYMVNRRAYYEPFIMIGGPWGYCEDADASFSFSGTSIDFTGDVRHSHRRVLPMLIECHGAKGDSVWGCLREQLQGGSRTSFRR